MRSNASFYQAEEVEFNWSSNGECVLCEASVDVDHSGASYYGSKRLYLLDIQIFSVMNHLLRYKISENKEEHQNVEVNRKLASGNIDTLIDIFTMCRKNYWKCSFYW